MKENKATSLPEFSSVEELVEFFDTHDMGDYAEHLPEAHFDVDLKARRFLVSIDEALMKRLTEIARSQQVSAETLIHSWLEEKAQSAAQSGI